MTTTPAEHLFGVWLRDLRVGTLAQRGDHTRFVLSESYLADPDRPVLGLMFEQDLHARHAAKLRLPCWFSNLLPEGRLRDWIAAERHVPAAPTASSGSASRPLMRWTASSAAGRLSATWRARWWIRCARSGRRWPTP